MNFQLWESKEDGTYVNAASGFVLEAPTGESPRSIYHRAELTLRLCS